MNDGDEVSGEDFGKVIDDEVGTVWAQSFIVQIYGDFGRVRFRFRLREEGEERKEQRKKKGGGRRNHG